MTCRSEIMPAKRPTAEIDRREYIIARSIPIPFAGCWLWLMSFGRHGYGLVNRDLMPGDRSGTAHRMSLAAFKGPIPDGLHALHTCDNRWCVNPDHLYAGTPKQNGEDMARRARSNLGKRLAYSHPARSLTPEQAEYVRTSTEPKRVLARKLGVGRTVIRNIKRGVTYRDGKRAA